MTEWDEIENNWDDYKAKVFSNWNRLTLEQIDNIHGNKIALIEYIQLKYACGTDEAERQVNDWLDSLLGTNLNNNESTQNLDEKLKQNQNTPETIRERDSEIDSPFHKGY